MKLFIGMYVALSMASHPVQNTALDLQSYDNMQKTRIIESRAKACAYEAVRKAVVDTGSVEGSGGFARLACMDDIKAMLRGWKIPRAEWNEVTNVWLYPILKLALESFHQHLTEGWPDEWPEPAESKTTLSCTALPNAPQFCVSASP